MNLTTEAPKPLSRNCAETIHKRMEWIRNSFPEVLSCDPYRSPRLVEAIRDAMKSNGLYKMTKYSSSFASDETIIRYILKAQNKKPINLYKKSPKNRIYSGW